MCGTVFTVEASGQSAPANVPPRPINTSTATEAQLAQQPTHCQEIEQDKGRILTAVSTAPDKYAIIEPYLMEYETPVALAVQRQFPFSVFADIVLLTSHRVLMFKRFFTKIDMFDVNYVDFKDVTVRQGFFTSALTVRADDRRSCTIARLITEQALNVYRLCQNIETKARMARRRFQLEENRSKTTQMQVNNLLAPPESLAFPTSPRPISQLPHQDVSNVGDEEFDPFRLGE